MQERKENQLDFFGNSFIEDLGYMVRIDGPLLEKVQEAIKTRKEWEETLADISEARKDGKEITELVDKLSNAFEKLSSLESSIGNSIILRIEECPF